MRSKGFPEIDSTKTVIESVGLQKVEQSFIVHGELSFPLGISIVRVAKKPQSSAR